jgi:hypothetical protein
MSNWLDGIDVASPCHESWDEMSGDQRERHCDKCEQTVFDLTGMARVEAEDLVRRTQGGEKVCVRFRRRADGTVLTADCPTQVRKTRGAWTQARSVAAGLFALAGGLAAGCTNDVIPGATMGAPIAPRTTNTVNPPTTVDPTDGEAPCCDGTGACCATMQMGEMTEMGDLVAPPLVPAGGTATPTKDPKDCGVQPAKDQDQPERRPVMMGRMKAPPVNPNKAPSEKPQRRLPTAGSTQ